MKLSGAPVFIHVRPLYWADLVQGAQKRLTLTRKVINRMSRIRHVQIHDGMNLESGLQVWHPQRCHREVEMAMVRGGK